MTARIDPPCDSDQPADHGPSWYLTRRRRTFAEAVRDISHTRDLEPWVFDELRLRRHTATIIDIAHARSARAGRR
jgi:hypothetical protein